MIIGNFKYDAKADSYTGDVTTLTFHRNNVQLRPNDKPGEKGPEYRVVGQTASGNVEFGAAWKRTSEKNGQEFLSVSLDDPSFAAAVNGALFVDDDGENAVLVWNRQKPEAKDKPEAKAKPKAKSK
jgi:uncharacterized protein (DUF736 family)